MLLQVNTANHNLYVLCTQYRPSIAGCLGNFGPLGIIVHAPRRLAARRTRVYMALIAPFR